MMRRLSLDDRIRARHLAEEQAAAPARAPEPQAPRLWPVPVSVVPPAARIVTALLEARRIVSDPFEIQGPALLLSDLDSEPTWYQSSIASKVASDLQQSSAMSIVLQAVEIAEAGRDKERELQRTLNEMMAQGKSLVNRLQRYEAEFWRPDLKDFAGRIVRMVHPDIRDRRLEYRFTADNLRAMYQRALAARAGTLSTSTGLFVRDAERMLVWQIRTYLADGLSLEQIAEREPHLSSDLDLVRWLRFVKARQVEVAEQLVHSRRQKEEDHTQGHLEAFSVIVGALDAIVAYASLAEYPCQHQLLTLQGHLQQAERMVDEIPNIEKFPMARFKAEQLQRSIADLVAPVVRMAQVVLSARELPNVTEAQRTNALNGALVGLNSVIEYADSAARSYIEWIEERNAARSGAFNKSPNFRPAAW